MASKRLEIQIRGTDEDNGDVQFDEFIKQLETVKKTLNEIARVVSEGGSVYFRVIDLRHNSPASIVLEVAPH